jgi:capsid portal protein
VAFIIPTWIYPDTSDEIVAEIVFKIFEMKLLPARFPVTDKLLAVVEPSVEDPEVVRFAIYAFVVVEFVTVARVIVALLAKKFIELEFVDEDVVALLVLA